MNERRTQIAVLTASVLLMMIGSGAMFLLVVALKPIAAEMGWPRSVPSIAYSLQFIGTGIGGLVMGHWLDRSGMAMPAALGGLMIAAGTVVAGLATSQVEFYFTYGIMLGLLGQATLFGPLSANITHWFVRRRGIAVGLVAGGQSLAGIVWPPIFRYFNEAIGWRETFLWFGLFAFANMLPLSLVMRRKSPSQVAEHRHGAATQQTDGNGMTALGVSPGTLQAILCAAIVGCCIAMSLPLAHLVSHATDIGIPLARAAELLSVMLMASFVSRTVCLGLVADWVGGLRGLFLFSLIQGLSLVLLALMEGQTGIFIVAVVYGLGYGAILPSYPLILREYVPAVQIGRRTGMVLLFGTFGMAIGGWLGGLVFDMTGSYVPAFLIGAGANAANLLIVASLILRARSGAAAITAA